jgi:GGDEF domain-containing protein
MEERLTHLSRKSPLFSHDGIHDSQTHLAAPPFFYEQLRRQVALSLRTQISFSAVKITFTPHTVDGESHQVGAEDILRFSCELRSLIRGSECIGRLGVNECVVLISDGEIAAQQLMARLYSSPSLSVNHTLHISLSMVTSLRGESGLALLNRLDEAPLSTH